MDKIQTIQCVNGTLKIRHIIGNKWRRKKNMGVTIPKEGEERGAQGAEGGEK